MNIDYQADRGVLTARPAGALDQSDFQALAAELDGIKKQGGPLKGVLIHSREFPGYARMSDMLAHARFVKEHGKDVDKVALCTDTPVAPILAAFGRIFAGARVETFPFAAKDEAEKWLSS